MLDGVFWIARTGVQWRDLPEYFGKWSSVYRQFRRWTLSGLWELILEALNESGEGSPTVQMIDSTIIRAHHCAAGAKGGIRDKVLGAQKVALRPKFISAEITGGEVSDFKGYDLILEADGLQPKVLLADKGYDADFIREDMEQQGGVAVIPTKRNRKQQIPVDGYVYPD